jgi:hypothetical protein
MNEIRNTYGNHKIKYTGKRKRKVSEIYITINIKMKQRKNTRVNKKEIEV